MHVVPSAGCEGCPKAARAASQDGFRADFVADCCLAGASWASSGFFGAKVASIVDRQLLAVCFANVPLMKSIPKREAPLFARMWGALLHEAIEGGTPSAWFEFFRFPKCILLSPVRGGRRISRSQSQADVVKPPAGVG